ncbi:MAG: 50S ribosomal protein L11 methyltransferase [Ghiorsea sp.]
MQNVTCVELKVAANAINEETFSQLMTAFHALGGSEETEMPSGEAIRIAWFEVEDNQEEQYLRLKTAAQVLGAEENQIRIETLNDDWETAWQKNWTAISIGQSMCVRPSFCEAIPGQNIDIVLDPGMAFGTGTHPTTFLCLEAVENYCLKQAPQSLLDMGAGSGLLAIAAGKMGALDIHAIDYDPLSVEASDVNAGINGVSLTSTLDHTPPTRQFELVVANILAGPLLDMSQKLADTVATHLILSGLLITQVPGIIKAYANAGLKHSVTHTKEEWAAVEFVR